MKTIIALAALIATAPAALAQSTTARVPTGIDVPGPAYYTIAPGSTRVIVRAEICDARARHRREQACLNETQSVAEAAAATEREPASK